MFLLDEPDANLDRRASRFVAEVLRELSLRGMVAFAAHTPELLAVADRVVALEGVASWGDDRETASGALLIRHEFVRTARVVVVSACVLGLARASVRRAGTTTPARLGRR